MILESLDGYFEGEGNRLLFTGTLDPTHRGHIDCIIEGFRRVPDLQSALVVPHNWTTPKKPVDVRLRIKWLMDSLGHFLSGWESRILISADERAMSDPTVLYSFIAQGRSKVFQVVGKDKSPEEISARGPVIPLISERSDGVSSTLIRRAVESDNITEEVRALVSRSVLDEILRNGHYRQVVQKS